MEVPERNRTTDILVRRYPTLINPARGMSVASKRDGGPFFHKPVQTNAPRTRKCFELLMFGIRQPNCECRHDATVFLYFGALFVLV